MIHTITDADNTLAEIGDLRRKLSTLTQKKDAAVAEATLKFSEEISAIEDRLKTLAGTLEAFAENAPDVFGDARSVALVNGKFGYRSSTRLETVKNWSWGKVLETVKKMGKAEAVSVKESVNKNIIKQWADDALKKIGVVKVTDNRFWYEV